MTRLERQVAHAIQSMFGRSLRKEPARTSVPVPPGSESSTAVSAGSLSQSEMRPMVKKYAEALLGEMENTESPEREIITYSSLKYAWDKQSENNCNIIEQLGLTDAEITYVESRLLRTFSILVVILWDGWEHFPDLFLRGGQSNPPNADEVVMNLSSSDLTQCLGVSWASQFRIRSAAFNPIVIEFGRIMASRESIRPGSITECNNYVQIPDGARLPFLLNEGDSELGRGGFGIVTRETIAAGHFLENGTLNRVGKVIARKRFDNKILFDRERVVATFLQNSRLEHKNILVPLAMISSKSESSILMNEADCNLEVFLREDGRMGSAISLKSLLGQVANLAHALNLLHNPIRPDPTIFHLDLKPQNVLVNLSREPDQAGTWMLADFGMSTHFRANMYTDVTGIDHSGPQGLLRLGRTDTYVAPDAKGSACSDVWSLGCILCRVVCRKRYGIEGLRVFDGLRSKDATTDYFYRGTAVNPYVSALLDEFCTSGCEMTEQCGHLLKGVLSIDERKRPGALKLHDSLKRIIGAQEAPSTRPTPPLQLHIVPDILEGTPQRPIQDSTVGIQQANPVFLAIENQSETNASIQLTALFKGSIPSYSSIKDYDEDLTPLCHASKKGYTKIVKFLLEKGAHVDEADKRKNTPLMYACREGHCDTAKFLIDQGADWNLQGADGYSCLHFATEARKINIVEMLVGKQAGATVKLDANLVSSLDRTPLELHLNRHSRDARYELMKQLMSLGANAQVSSSNQHHTTAVQMMLGDNDQQAMEILVTDNNRTWKVSRKEVQRRGGMKSILRRNNRLVE